MPRFRAVQPGGSPTDPVHYRPPTPAELKHARRNALAYMGIDGGISQADAARITGRPRRWWQGMELTNSPRRMSFADWVLFSIYALGEDPAKFCKVLARTKRKTFSRAAFVRAINELNIKHVECRRDPANFCAPSRQEIVKLRKEVQTLDGQEISKAKAAAAIGRSLRWWQKLEQPATKGFPSISLGFADYAAFRILAYGDDPALYASGLKRMMSTRQTGYEANKYGHLRLAYHKKHKKLKKAA